MLNNALAQTGWTGDVVTADNWRSLTLRRLEQLNWSAVVADVRPFLMNSGEADLLNLSAFTRLLDR